MATGEALDPEALFDDLVDGAVVTVDPATDAVHLTEAFDATLRIYTDTYGAIDDAEFHRTIAELFDLADTETAAAKIEELGVTRAELAAFLALRSHLEDPPGTDALAVMATMIVDAEVGSPVPAALTTVTDESFENFLDEHGDVVLTVWKNHCDPCDGLKRDLDDIMDAAPPEVVFAGLDGEASTDLRRDYEIEAAPTALLFRDGELVDRIRGRAPVLTYEDLIVRIYG